MHFFLICAHKDNTFVIFIDHKNAKGSKNIFFCGHIQTQNTMWRCTSVEFHMRDNAQKANTAFIRVYFMWFSTRDKYIEN